MSKKHPVYCSWCSTEFFPTVVGYSDQEGSHSICKTCSELKGKPKGKFRILKVKRDRLEKGLRHTADLLLNLDADSLSHSTYLVKRRNLKTWIKSYKTDIKKINKHHRL